MSAKHTPGPWNFEQNISKDYFSIIDGKRKVLAHKPHGIYRSSSDEIVTDFANARLMAAAPDLLFALECFLGGRDVTFLEAAQIATEAVAKAKGEAS